MDLSPPTRAASTATNHRGGTASPIEQLVAELGRNIPLDVLPPVATGKDVAALIGSTENALAQDRYLNRGVPYTRVGRRVRYLRADVLKFLAENRIGNT